MEVNNGIAGAISSGDLKNAVTKGITGMISGGLDPTDYYNCMGKFGIYLSNSNPTKLKGASDTCEYLEEATLEMQDGGVTKNTLINLGNAINELKIGSDSFKIKNKKKDYKVAMSMHIGNLMDNKQIAMQNILSQLDRYG